ncbi:hypothetical protein A6V39_01365 [Candidatus Mycoplasma haematobovis]|uniref:Uncharacterized protein n=1 Tax=Candidatus Mycoplasma haematobovis TaxID=432608 RepID=A0A1A9QE08_9MOLU|nr:hypothetical protein [Candidatus Mycoplasma haematobovis]OAL10703.1 hypothetical protein A6V39_01365 [Candidatus Mycoplasma haematobovis]
MNTKPLLIKSAIGLAGAGGIGFTAHQGYQAFQSKYVREEKNKVKSQLESKGYIPLTKGSTHFTAILSSYTTISKAKAALKFGTFTGEGDTRDPKDILWEHCQNAFNDDVSDDLFNKTRKWCVEPISVSSILTKQGHTKLDTSSQDVGIKGKWDAKITKHRKQDSTQKIATLDVGTGVTEITDEHRNRIKQKCNEIGEVKSHDDKYEDNLGIFKIWCIDN